MANKRVDKKAFDSNFVAGSFNNPIDPNSHRKKTKQQKLYYKGKGTDNPHEKDAFLKRAGPRLPGV